MKAVAAETLVDVAESRWKRANVARMQPNDSRQARG
jgi:hypothetical protein